MRPVLAVALGPVVGLAQERLEFEVATVKPLDRTVMNLTGGMEPSEN